MPSYAPDTRKFISAVWRRIVVVRIAESIAIATAAASAAGLALIPILWLRGQSALPLALAMLLLGGISGGVWGISRRPTRFQAAVEADRQLNLQDLLGTVHLLSRENAAGDPWRDAIACVSDERCRCLRPSAVVVNRLGLRAWGGVGILGALLITMGLFTARPPNVSAAASSPESNSPAPPQSIQPSIAVANPSPQSTARPPGPGGNDDISNRAAEQDQPDDSHRDSSSQSKLAQSHSAAGADSSTGGGAVITHASQPPIELPAIGDTGAAFPHSGQAIAATAGQSDSRAKTPGDSNAVTATGSANHRSPPWTSDQWPADSAAAQAAINAGHVPDSDADLVRDYFSRD
ncbi:MAG: hypothetical protein ABSB74_14960 [Tepidisphaeraceae bacterium]